MILFFFFLVRQLHILVAIVYHNELKKTKICYVGKPVFSDMKCVGNLSIFFFSLFILF